MLPDDPRHGTQRGYHLGCRCDRCRAAGTRYHKAVRLRMLEGRTWKIPAFGAQRRIQALMALGWTTEDIRIEAGWGHRNCVRRILVGQKGKPQVWLERKTHERIRDVFERLSMRLPEPTPCRNRTRARAARLGYAPPLAWTNIDDPADTPKGVRRSEQPHRDEVDPVVVRRLLDGESVPSNRAEKNEAMRRWRAMGRSERSLCEIHGWRDGRYGRDVA